MRISEKYCFKTTPLAHRESMVVGDKYRFTVLTSRLIRAEYSQSGNFEDRATQVAVNRVFDVPSFTVSDTDDLLTITTEHIELTYTKQEFSPNSLQIKYLGKNSAVKAGNNSTVWGYGSAAGQNLGGTTRTLDKVDGKCSLENGIFALGGAITTIDDSASLVICEDGWLEPRKENNVDTYIFCYGDKENVNDYRQGLKDYYGLTGRTPMLPRFALGNWWSRYHAYTQEEYTELIKRFRREEVPFSVAVIDMDWHNVKIDPKHGTGWTGYTWNKELFPDHRAFLKFLYDEGMHTSLNVHPQEGVSAHEDAYKNMAEAMGVDPETEKNIPFEIENPKFVENYFKQVHHPLEDDGVDFWWIDWQQGNTTRIPGLDPLWMLNHFHYIDREKDGKRGLLFSRYSGPGSHRYPIGFSGDTIISWDSLEFQPYFTLTASNIGYGWWSHDIGGHMFGYRDEELATRWYQLGTFSPINRLHSNNRPFLGREPWKYNRIAEYSMKKFLKLRHELIPYLYTMNYRAHKEGCPLVQPLYYDYSDMIAYEFKNEFLFGTEMIVSPIVTPHDDKTMMGSVKTYIPEGEWYDFFNNLHYTGGRNLTLFREQDEMPVLVKSGGIIPMAKLKNVNDTDNPESLKIKVFAGADNVFEMYEDDGETNEYKDGAYVITKMELKWGGDVEFTINAPAGDVSLIPEKRNYDLEFIGIEDCADIAIYEDGVQKEYTKDYYDNVLYINLSDVSGTVKVQLKNVKKAKNHTYERICARLERFEHISNITKNRTNNILLKNKSPNATLCDIMQLDPDRNVLLALSEIICAES